MSAYRAHVSLCGKFRDYEKHGRRRSLYGECVWHHQGSAESPWFGPAYFLKGSHKLYSVARGLEDDILRSSLQ